MSGCSLSTDTVEVTGFARERESENQSQSATTTKPSEHKTSNQNIKNFHTGRTDGTKTNDGSVPGGVFSVADCVEHSKKKQCYGMIEKFCRK